MTPADVASLYCAIPGAFEPVPILADSSGRDDYCPRATARLRMSTTFAIPAYSTLFLCPSPFTAQDENGSSQWLGSYLYTPTAGQPLLPSTDVPTPPSNSTVWHTSVTINAAIASETVSQNQFYAGTAFPGQFSGSYGPISLCGGFFCVDVALPYNGAAAVYNFGSTDAPQVNGILTGDRWRSSPSCNAALGAPVSTKRLSVEPRRQCHQSATFHSADPLSAVQSIKPDYLYGANNKASKTYGFSLVPDKQFTPPGDAPNGVNDWTAADFYPANNAFSGLLAGQGCMYIQNTSGVGGSDITVVVEQVMDFCVMLENNANIYVSPETYAYGTSGILAHPVATPCFPGVSGSCCEDVVFHAAWARLPEHMKDKRHADLLRVLVASYVERVASTGAGQIRLIPMTRDPGTAIAHAAGAALTKVKSAVATGVTSAGTAALTNLGESLAAKAKNVGSNFLQYLFKGNGGSAPPLRQIAPIVEEL